MLQVQSTSFTHHGGRIDAAMRHFGDAPKPWIDLSTGINPRPWGPDEAPAVELGPLPSRDDLAALEAAAADHFGTSPANVAAVPGSEIALRLLPLLGAPGPIRALEPSYGTHCDIAEALVPAAAIDGAAREGGTLLLANPNNPDGLLHAPASLMALADTLGGSGGWLAVDEAFADAHEGTSIVPHLADGACGRAQILVFRSFGKFFGLAGLRLGFLVAPQDITAKLRALLGDWPVCAHAIALGTRAYRDSQWIAGARSRLAADAAALDAVLIRHGLVPQGASPLFRLVRHAAATALFEGLARRGILTRPFAANPDWLRFGLPGSQQDLIRLDGALGAALKECAADAAQ